MDGAARVAAAALLAFAVAAGVVVWGGDTTVLVQPPESVAEQFTRAVVARRYEVAMKDVDPHSAVTAADVRRLGDELRARAGAVTSVEGKPGAIRGDRADAAAIVMASAGGGIEYEFRLTRSHHVWKITAWREAP